MSFPEHWGMGFTQTVHNKAEGPTDPKNINLPGNFVVAITGAGKGIGYGISLAFAYAGAKGIVISARTQANLDKLQADIKSINPEIEILSQICDTMKGGDVQSLAAATKEKFGRLDVIVANAGIVSKYVTRADGKLYQPEGILEDDDFALVIDTNLVGSHRVAKHFVPLLQATTDGVQTYIGISSAASHMTDSSMVPLSYNLSKIAMNRMVESIHNDHFEKDGIQAFSVHPGAVLTPQTEGHHTTQLGKFWSEILVDDQSLCGGFLVWLTQEKRPWLSGRYLSSNWDVEELLAKKDDIVARDLLQVKMAI